MFRHRCRVALPHPSLDSYGGLRKTKSATLTLSLASPSSQPRPLFLGQAGTHPCSVGWIVGSTRYAVVRVDTLKCFTSIPRLPLHHFTIPTTTSILLYPCYVVFCTARIYGFSPAINWTRSDLRNTTFKSLSANTSDRHMELGTRLSTTAQSIYTSNVLLGL